MERDETRGETAYKWAVRAMYAGAVALNLWYLVEQYRDTPEGKRLLTRAENVTHRLIKPWNERKRFRRMADEVMVEAWITVDQAAKGETTNGDN